MEKNLLDALAYIEDHIRYGSTISRSNLDKILSHYTLTDEELLAISSCLKSLDIKINESKSSMAYHLEEIMRMIGSNKQIIDSDLRLWFEREYIAPAFQIKIKNALQEQGYRIISSADAGFCAQEEYLDGIELDDIESLDELFQDELFISELNQTQNNIVARDIGENNFLAFTQLEKALKMSDKATEKNVMNKILQQNDNLVRTCAHKYLQLTTSSLDKDDLMQAGRFGLLRAVDRYDLTTGYKFSTYAYHWIRQGIGRSIVNESTTIRIPVYLYDEIKKCIKIENQYWNQHGERCSDSYIAEKMKISIEKVWQLKKYKGLTTLASLDKLVGENEDTSLEELISNHFVDSVEDAVISNLLVEAVNHILACLKEREKEVIILRFGLRDGKEHTLEEIGRIYNVTRERIRQIERNALIKLKREADRKKVGEFL